MCASRVSFLKALAGFATASLLISNVQAAVGRTVGEAAVSSTGEATYSIRIFAPPGVKGMTPDLSLVYGHRQEEGLAGVGWSVSGLSEITRCPKTYAQDGAPKGVILTTTDRFCLDANQLRLVSGTYGAAGSTYRMEVDNVARITAFGTAGAGPAYFEVAQKNGLIYEYGNSANSRIETLATGYGSTVRTWALNKIRDREGNEITFSYVEDGPPNGDYRISGISYGGNPGQGTGAPYLVTFLYEDQPSGDIDSQYGAGGTIKDIKRIDRIDITHAAPVSTLVRRYEISYEALSSTGRSRISSIQECAGSPLDCLPATTFSYHNGTSGFASEVSTGTTIPVGATVLPIDINGDGRTDLVYSSTAGSGSGTWMYRLANSAGGYNSAVNSGITNTNHTQAIATDYNSDGLEDFLVPYSGTTWWAVRGSTSGLLSPINTNAPVASTAGNAVSLDTNGDGRDDLVWAENVSNDGGPWIANPKIWTRYRLSGTGYSATPTSIFSVTGTTYLIGPAFAGPYPQSRARHYDVNGDGLRDVAILKNKQIIVEGFPEDQYFVDVILGGSGAFAMAPQYARGLPIEINGDGYTDIVYDDYSGAVKYRLSTGLSFGPAISGPSLANLDFAKAVARDWDGDGYEDLLIPSTTTATWHYMRSSGEGLAAAVNTTLAISSPRAVYPLDVNGDGLDDLGYIRSDGVFAFRLHSGIKADLLQAATDGNGNSITFNYAPITQAAYTKYTNAVFPEQDYTGPIYVVQTAVPSDGVGGTYTLSHSYSGAQLNLQGRGIVGFDKKITIDSRNGVAVTEYFRRDFPYIGQLYQRDIAQADGTLIQRVTNTWSRNQGGLGFEVYFLPFVSETTERNYETEGTFNGSEINTAVTAVLIDLYGTPYDITTTTTESSTANGVQGGATYVERILHTSMNDNTITWCLGRPGQTEYINSHNQAYGAQITRTVTRSWDTNAYCRLTQEVTEPASSSYKVTRAIGYDSFGNINSETITGIGMAARSSTILWDPVGHFPQTITNALNQSRTLTWNPAYGLQTAETDPNGIAVSWQYDFFRRRTRETRPDGTYTDFTLTACNAGNSYCSTSDNRIRTKIRASSRRTNGTEIRYDDGFLDQFDRLGREDRRTLGGAPSIIRTNYDALGRISQRSVPYFAGNPIHYTTIQYDLLNRPKQTSRPIDDGNPTPQTAAFFYEGLTSRIVDPQNKETKKITDALGRVVRSADAGGYFQQFDYDAFGSVRRVVDSLSNQLIAATYAYGIGAFRLTSNDMDMGAWTYTPNALGEIVSHKDAKNITFTATYDKLSRPLTRVDAEGTTTWTWGTSAASFNIGQLASVSAPGSSESFTYDNKGRLVQRSIVSDATYQINYDYDATSGQLDALTYPTSTSGYRLKLKYGYQYGILQAVSNFNTPTTVYWQANAADAHGNIIDETLGNGLRTIRGFDAVTGWPDYLQSGPAGGTARQNMTFQWDMVGNLKQRQDLNRSLKEDFFYDDLYRLDYSKLNDNPTPNVDLDYDALGNVKKKTDVHPTATWTYHATKKHAVITAGSNSYTYDANGNQITRNGQSVTWTSYNYPSRININTSPSQYHEFFYDADRQRWKQVYVNGANTETTIFVGGILEKATTGATTEYRHYIYAGDRPVALYTRPVGGTNTNRYLLTDHQGSVTAITNNGGAVYVDESFTAYGDRRDPSDWSGPPSAGDEALIAGTTSRGYTFHTNLAASGLIHMNGRVADGLTGRFLSADPYVPNPGFTQSFNRYSYVYNNPLTYTDPSGFDGCLTVCTFIVRAVVATAINFIFGKKKKRYPPSKGCFVASANGCYGQAGMPRTTGFNPLIVLNGDVDIFHEHETTIPDTSERPVTFMGEIYPFYTYTLRKMKRVRLRGYSILSVESYYSLSVCGRELLPGDPNGAYHACEAAESTMGPLEFILGLRIPKGVPARGLGVGTRAATTASNLPFRSGDVILRTFNSSKGPIDLAAEVQISGSTLHLRSIAVFPRGPERLSIGAREVAAFRDQLAQEARDLGFEHLRITGTRITGANPGKEVDIVIDLLGGQ